MTLERWQQLYFIFTQRLDLVGQSVNYFVIKYQLRQFFPPKAGMPVI